MRFDGRVALITAAASGIGRATAGTIGAEGDTVVAVDIAPDRLERAVTEIRLSGAKAHAQCADALDPKQVGRVVEETVGEFGRIDILVNAVGGSTIIERPAQARVICFLASADADFVTGVTIDVTGGL